MLGLVKSCIGTKFTSQFGDLIAVSNLIVNCFLGAVGLSSPPSQHLSFLLYAIYRWVLQLVICTLGNVGFFT